ncbi:MAG: M14 family metallopeptidase [Lachnospiraceae bacterium]|nr:M14 family metallopeptidase [Lachnospiraceae bacterium]
MVETVVSVELTIDETFAIKKNHIRPERNKAGKRICIVTGTHGDELEGQFVCYTLNQKIKEHPEYLEGVVDIYPALNPLGIDSITRGIPGYDLDMNRIFPGSKEGTMEEYVAAGIVDDIKGADLCVDIHASNIFLREIPQIRISEETREQLVPLAMNMNVDYIWVHAAATVLRSTLAHSLNEVGTPTLVVEMGIWTGPVAEVRTPVVSTDGAVSFLNAGRSGVFVPTVEHNVTVKKHQRIGMIINPLTGELKEQVLAPEDGLLFTLQEYPVVDEGSLIARLLTVKGGGKQ